MLLLQVLFDDGVDFVALENALIQGVVAIVLLDPTLLVDHKEMRRIKAGILGRDL